MTKKQTILVFYAGVAVVCVAILWIAMKIRPSLTETYAGPIIDQGQQKVENWFPIKTDLKAINQDNKEVQLSELHGKVWVVAQFFAVCPHCAVRNGEELRKMYDAFKDHPDFHIVCISVDPETDQPEKLADYAKALGADTSDWWFLNAGEARFTHQYLEKEMKFFKIEERSDPADIEENGKYKHDMGFLLVNRNFEAIGKWPLAEARSEGAAQRDPTLYQRLKDDMFTRIRAELDRKPSSGS